MSDEEYKKSLFQKLLHFLEINGKNQADLCKIYRRFFCNRI